MPKLGKEYFRAGVWEGVFSHRSLGRSIFAPEFGKEYLHAGAWEGVSSTNKGSLWTEVGESGFWKMGVV